MATLLTKGTCKHMASSLCHPGFHFLGQPVFLQVLIIFPLDVHKNTWGKGRKGKTVLYASWYSAGCVLSVDGHKLWAATHRLSFLGGEVLPDRQGLAGGGKRRCGSKQTLFSGLLQALLALVTVNQGQNNPVWGHYVFGEQTQRNTVPSLIFWLQEH